MRHERDRADPAPAIDRRRVERRPGKAASSLKAADVSTAGAVERLASIVGNQAMGRVLGASGDVAQLRKFATRDAELDTDVGLDELHQEVLPSLMTPVVDGNGLASMYVAVMSDLEEREDPAAMPLLDQIESVARAALANLLIDPRVARLDELGLLAHDQVRFWLSIDYTKAPPENLARGLIAEALSAHAQHQKHGPASRVVSGLKVRDLKTDKDVAEIDNLTVIATAQGWRPVELVEAKAGAVKKQKMITQLSAKLRGLKLVADGKAKLTQDGEDVTAEYDLGNLHVAMTSAMTGESPDLMLDAHEIAALYEALEMLRVLGYNSLRVLAI